MISILDNNSPPNIFPKAFVSPGKTIKDVIALLLLGVNDFGNGLGCG